VLPDPMRLLATLRAAHEAIRDEVVRVCEQQEAEQLAAVAGYEGGDVIYALDRVCEPILLERFEVLARDWSCVVVAEGLGQEGLAVFPPGCSADQARLRVLVDPIDGTRGLMYGKRPAWILTGVAPNRGEATTLADIELAIQTEIPLPKQHLSDMLWAVASQGAAGERYNRLTGERQPLRPRPSTSTTIAHGFGAVHRVSPGARPQLAAIDDAVVERLLGPTSTGPPLVWEDQYISVGGQLYGLMMGHDRWIADLRPLVAPDMSACAHPYDLASELVAREAGVIVSDPTGRRLAAPMDVTSRVAWVAFANPALAGQVGTALRHVLSERGLEAEQWSVSSQGA
jgi:hypothetical protein